MVMWEGAMYLYSWELQWGWQAPGKGCWLAAFLGESHGENLRKPGGSGSSGNMMGTRQNHKIDSLAFQLPQENKVLLLLLPYKNNDTQNSSHAFRVLDSLWKGVFRVPQMYLRRIEDYNSLAPVG